MPNFYNAAYDIVTIYSPDGEPHECSRLNARELVATHGFKWKISAPTEDAPQEVEAETVEVQTAPVEEQAEPSEEVAQPNVNDADTPLETIALDVMGQDVKAYLDGFSAASLRSIADERYGVSIHARTGKEKTIEKILELEEEKRANAYD